MKTLPLSARLVSAVFAVAITLGLFGNVLSLAEPQRGMLIAKNQGKPQLPSAPVEVAMTASGWTQEVE